MVANHEPETSPTQRLSRRRLLVLGAGALGALAGSSLLAACGGSSNATVTPRATTAATTSSGGAGAATTSSGGASAATPTSAATTSSASPATGGTAIVPIATSTWASTSTGNTPKPGGTLITAATSDADNLDPHRSLTAFAGYVSEAVTDTVIALTTDLELEPILLESIEVSADLLTYTMHVRGGITFHDGKQLDAAAIAQSHERANNDQAAYPGQFYGATWQVIDPKTVNMLMPKPNSGVMLILAFDGCGIVSPKALEQLNDDMSQHPVGSGPFTFKEWVRGDHATLEAFDGYKNFHTFSTNPGRPYLDELVMRVIPEEQTEVAAFEAGEIHLLTLPSQQVAKYEGNADYQLLKNEQSTTMAYLAPVIITKADGSFGWVPPLDDPKLRQAIGYALNADEIISGILAGLAIRDHSSEPTGNPGYSDQFQQMGYDYDPEHAKQLLDEAGWTAGSGDVREKDGQKLRVVLWCEAGATRERICQLIQNYLQQVGFEVKFEALEVATFLDRRLSGDAHLVHSTYNWNDPDIVWWLGNDTRACLQTP